MPVSTDRDKVRLMIGDTDETDALLSDDEVDFFVASRTVIEADTGGTIEINLPAAAADCAGAIAAEYAREFNFSEDGQTFQRAQRVSHYMTLEQSLRARAGGVSVPVTNAGTVTT